MKRLLFEGRDCLEIAFQNHSHTGELAESFAAALASFGW